MSSPTWNTVQGILDDMLLENKLNIYSQCHSTEKNSFEDMDFLEYKRCLFLWAQIHIPLSCKSRNSNPPIEDIYIGREICSELQDQIALIPTYNTTDKSADVSTHKPKCLPANDHGVFTTIYFIQTVLPHQYKLCPFLQHDGNCTFHKCVCTRIKISAFIRYIYIYIYCIYNYTSQLHIKNVSVLKIIFQNCHYMNVLILDFFPQETTSMQYLIKIFLQFTQPKNTLSIFHCHF